MMMIAVILMAACVGFEIYLVNKIPFLLDILENHPLIALGFSLALSMGLGAAFGAAGLIVFFAGVVSTFVAQGYYKLRRAGVIDAVAAQIDAAKARYYEKKDVYARRARQLVQGVMFCWKVVIAPFVFIGMCMDRIDDFKNQVSRVKARFSRS